MSARTHRRPGRMGVGAAVVAAAAAGLGAGCVLAAPRGVLATVDAQPGPGERVVEAWRDDATGAVHVREPRTASSVARALWVEGRSVTRIEGREMVTVRYASARRADAAAGGELNVSMVRVRRALAGGASASEPGWVADAREDAQSISADVAGPAREGEGDVAVVSVVDDLGPRPRALARLAGSPVATLGRTALGHPLATAQRWTADLPGRDPLTVVQVDYGPDPHVVPFGTFPTVSVLTFAPSHPMVASAGARPRRPVRVDPEVGRGWAMRLGPVVAVVTSNGGDLGAGAAAALRRARLVSP